MTNLLKYVCQESSCLLLILSFQIHYSNDFLVYLVVDIALATIIMSLHGEVNK